MREAIITFALCAIFCSQTTHAQTQEKTVMLYRIQIEGEKSDDDFIQIKNNTDEPVNIGGWKLKKRTQSGKEYSIKTIEKNTLLEPDTTFLWTNKDSEQAKNADATTTQTLSKNNAVALLNEENEIIDAIAWGNGHENLFENTQETEHNPEKNEILTQDDNRNWSVKKERLEEKPEETTYQKILLNEILPNPKGEEKENEFIELYNPTKEDVNIGNYILKDASKTGKYTIPKNTIIKANNFFTVTRKDFSFAMNNSGKETVTLLSPDETMLDETTYEKAKKNVSYNRTPDNTWRWSKKTTPGKENVLNNLPYGKMEIEKNIYRNTYADFSIGTKDNDKDNIKITWHFGDGKKSYKKETRHKYTETGTYHGSVTLDDGSEKTVKKFTVTVKKFPHPNVRIRKIMPNPKGDDAKNEWIEVENKSKQTLNLKGWSVATGTSSKKLTNHPINEDIKIKPGKKAKITRKESNIVLGNKEGVIKLRYPDGKKAHETKYKSKTTIKEGVLYEKTDTGWQWTETQKKIEKETSTNNKEKIGLVAGTETTNLPIGGQSKEAFEKPWHKKHTLFTNIVFT
ncbi:MAG: lamin tail domain-containing protein, partial [Candidatus Moranbacteria bacterium]|nr:lamin tail domain-containing protein [Candidatus Moranbacteria bacterium]